MGRYIPPSLEGTTTPNRAAGKSHPLGSRARHLQSSGILTVRFELPFAIWCTTCAPEQIIAQGVRFNAQKKKVGMYFSSTIWGFRFKHTVCGGWIEIRTDPRSAEYVVFEGGRRRDYGAPRDEIGVRSGVSEEEKERLERDGGMGGLEKKVEDQRRSVVEKKRVEELWALSGRDWGDPYERNRKLRREFRVRRRKRHEDERSGEVLKERFGIEVDMLPGNEEDGLRADLVEFGEVKSDAASSKPLFREQMESKKRDDDRGEQGKRSQLDVQQLQHKRLLQKSLSTNSRTAVDPFLRNEQAWKPTAKRKRDGEGETEEPAPAEGVPLVDYDSDD